MKSNIINPTVDSPSSLIDWRNPDYGVVFAERRDRLLRMRGRPDVVVGLYEYYKDKPVEFINDWGCTFDPRNPERGLPAVVPFLLFGKQVEFIEWCYARWRGGGDGLAEKSRDMGVSWLCCAFAVWMFLFHGGVVVGFGSRKEEYVDKLGDPKSLFWKVREFIRFLPVEFVPEGWNVRSCAPYMRIMNPDNGSVIVGEAGDNIGRGNRASVYFVDEAAFLESPDSVDAALSQTTNCRIDVSTPNGNGNPFYRKRMSGKVPVFTFRWQDDPRKDEDWYAAQVAKLDPVVVAQEIDLDYSGSVENVFLRGDSVVAAQGKSALEVEAVGPWMVGIDAAHEGNDESVIHLRRGRFSLDQVVLKGKTNGPELAAVVEEQCRRLEKSGGSIGQLVIELDGPGVSCYDQLKLGRYRRYVQGVHTGAKLKNDKHYNRRAELWDLAREYLEEGGVLLPRDPELKSQLCAMRYLYKNGLLLMQSKKDYKQFFKQSPDRADAFILTFYPYNPRRRDLMSGPVLFAEAEYNEFL